MSDLERLHSLIRQHIEPPECEELIASTAALPASRASDRLWDRLAHRRPELFAEDINPADNATLVLALRYAIATDNDVPSELELDHSEVAALESMRAYATAVSGLNWTVPRHLIVAPDSLVAGTFRLYDGTASALSCGYQVGFNDLALYHEHSIREWRAEDPHPASPRLISILIHEETHLAVAATAPGSRGSCEGVSSAAEELAATLIQYLTYLHLIQGVEPTRADLLGYSDLGDRLLHGFLSLNSAWGPREAAVRACHLAAAAAMGEEMIAQSAGAVLQMAPRDALIRLGQALGTCS